MMKVPEKNRVTPAQDGRFGTTIRDGNNGLFLIKHGSDILQCIASDGMDWDHVSVTMRTKNRNFYSTPTWNIMCWVKDLFWDKEDVVVQFHPRESEYVNNHEFVLHLWRYQKGEFPTPNPIMVGVKS